MSDKEVEATMVKLLDIFCESSTDDDAMLVDKITPAMQPMREETLLVCRV